MAASPVREVEVEAMLASGSLSVDGKHPWKQANDKSWFKVVIPVKCEAKKNVALRIVVSVCHYDTSRMDFVLLWNNVIRVRGLCVNGSHGNRHTNDEVWHNRTHKHRWTDECHDRYAYTPTDITETTPDGVLREFCAECGIRCDANVFDLPTVRMNFDDL